MASRISADLSARHRTRHHTSASGTSTTSNMEPAVVHQKTGSGAAAISEQSSRGQIPPSPPSRAKHQYFVLPDPVAFRYLEEDPATTVVERQRELQGYECYVVEQWATSRSHPTFTITTYTGDPNHSILVGVLEVPTDESIWSPRLRVYFKALNQYHAQRRETTLGVLMITNLLGFPSSLTVIPVPDGDLKKHRFDFFVNENLKRLGCSGRAGLTLHPPTGATVAKFLQLYRTSDKNELYKSVIELVKLCQSALGLFAKLEIDYADGLLCDVTERAINDWWLDIGNPYYTLEPHDGILGPTTVAGLLGLLMGARNRLHATNAPVAKDAFDVQAMKRGISYFQKQQRMPRTRRLDRQTLDRLHKVTEKAASSGGWGVPKAVKSTVAELSGKGGEMVLDVVGRRDRAGISEIETCDFERFIQLVYGERSKWLWYGKPLKKVRDALIESTANSEQKQNGNVDGGALTRGLSFRQDERGGFTWTARKSVGDVLARGGQEWDDSGDNVDAEEEDTGIRGVLKRTSGFKEGKSGLGRIKGAVGLGSHHQKKESKDLRPQTPVDEGTGRSRRPLLSRAHSSPAHSPPTPTSPGQPHKLDWTIAAHKNLNLQTDAIPEHTAPEYAYQEERPVSKSSYVAGSFVSRGGQTVPEEAIVDQDSENETVDGMPSAAGSIFNESISNGALPAGLGTEQDAGPLMRRTTSYSHYISVHLQTHSEDQYQRHLSFSLAEDSVLTWTDVTADTDPNLQSTNAGAALAHEAAYATKAKDLRLAITSLQTTTATFTTSSLTTLSTLLEKLSLDQQTVESLCNPCLEQVHGLQTASEGILKSEKERLEEANKEIEMLVAKLEYELAGLKDRIEDVEAGVGEFEKNVRRVEQRIEELETVGKRDEMGWCVIQ